MTNTITSGDINGYTTNTFVQVHDVQVRGFLSSARVANYLGIRYAKIPARFRNAELLSLNNSKGIIDATNYGSRCPQPWNAGRERRQHLYEGVQNASDIPVSEFECLNLNIWTPPNVLEAMKLPVVVWIHGGGMIFGDGGPEYDGNNLIQESIILGKPFVFVTINYRMGFFGFLSSRELQAEAVRLGEEYCPNQGLRDQRLALEWVQANIQFFGGDSSNVTVAGQSAGGWAALCHLVTNVPLCHRGWIMSSTHSPFESDEEHQRTFDRLITDSGAEEGVDDSAKLASLRDLSPDQMNKLLGNKMLMRPAWDSQWFTCQEQATPIACISNFPEWVKGLVHGSVNDEFAMFDKIWKTWSPKQLREVITWSTPDPKLAEGILQAYGMNTDALKGLVDFSTDSFYAALPIILAKKMSSSLYRFDQKDTFEGSSYKDYAYHCLDTPHFNRFPVVAGPQASRSMRATADVFSRSIADFVHGKQPWEPFGDTGKVMVINGEQSGVVDWPESRWKRFMSTKEDAIKFANAGCGVVAYMQDVYTSR